MSLSLDKESFIEKYKSGIAQVIYQKISSENHNPVSVALKLMDGKNPFFLLESVEQYKDEINKVILHKNSRYSIIGMNPDLIFRSDDSKAYIAKDGKDFIEQNEEPLSCLRKLYKEVQIDLPKELPSMSSGLIGYMSYDAIRYTEKTIPNSNPDNIAIPVSMFMRPTMVLVFDAEINCIYIVRTIHVKSNLSPEQAFDLAKSDISNLITKIESREINQATNKEKNLNLEFTPHLSKQQYFDIISKSKEYIMAGDIFQIDPSQRFSTKFNLPPFALYRSLRQLNPSPFLFFLDFNDFQLVGSSPEIMVRLRNNKVTIRPLAGTRKRGKDYSEDQELSKDLLSDPKEISEHLMLIDLARNDVGRVAKPGSVKVTEKFIIEYYSHVMHISSNVEGEIDPKFDALDALFSALPVGTVSGAPKIRAMQLIDQLESERRSFYAGCVGYFAADGSMDTCITLRTGLIKDKTLYVQAGGGIVADSELESEYQETLNKAKALMKAAQDAIAFS